MKESGKWKGKVEEEIEYDFFSLYFLSFQERMIQRYRERESEIEENREMGKRRRTEKDMKKEGQEKNINYLTFSLFLHRY